MLTEEQQGIKDFIEEVSGDIAKHESVLSGLDESEFFQEEINGLFRLFHNIKGVSGMFDWQSIQEVFHIAESILVIYREKKIRPPADTCDLLLKTIDYFKTSAQYFLEHHCFIAKKPYELLYQLDHFLCELQELTASAGGKEAQNQQAGQKGKKDKDDSIRISAEKGEELMEIVSNFIQLQNKLITVLTNTSDSLALKSDLQRFSSQLQNFALSIRLSPLYPLLSSMNRIVNGTAREVNKKIKLKINGGETQLDRRVLELLREPLVHMIRNSVDHGIETPEERLACKKLEMGLITIDAFQQSGQVSILIADDGRGIDYQRLIKKALEKGVITEQTIPPTPKEALKLIFHPGFSTAEKVTNLSGRGVGMDSVKSAVESIGGSVDLETEVGSGTRFKLILPLSLAIVKSLTFSVGRQIYAVPQANVEEVITREMLQINQEIKILSDGTNVIRRRKQVIPVIALDQLFKISSTSSDCVYIIVKYRSAHFALKVDKIQGNRDFVSRPCPPMFGPIDVISGVTQLNSGEYIALLDLGILENLIQIKSGPQQGTSGTKDYSTENNTLSDIFRGQQKMVFFKSGRDFALAVQNIKEVLQLDTSKIEYLQDQCFITIQDKTYPVLRLYKIFAEQSKVQPLPYYTILLVSREDHIAAIICEQFYGIYRLPNEFDDTIRGPGILGITNLEQKSYLVPNIRTIYEMEFPNKFQRKMEGQSSCEIYTVMIVEDDRFFAANLTDFLQSHGLLAVHCLNGLEAKEILTRIYLEQQKVVVGKDITINRIDYIVTDYEMPQMNGLELLSWIRKTAETKFLPVSMCTAVAEAQTKAQALALGIESYNGKLRYELFLQDILNRKKQNDLGINTEANKGTGLVPAHEERQNTRILTFSLNQQIYAIDIALVKEISRAPVATWVPGMPNYACSMVAFRGNPIPVIDLREAVTKNPDERQQIVGQFGKHICALWVDKVHQVKRPEQMHRSVGINKKTFGSLHALISDVYWDQDKTTIAYLGPDKLKLFIDKTIERVKKITLHLEEVDFSQVEHKKTA